MKTYYILLLCLTLLMTSCQTDTLPNQNSTTESLFIATTTTTRDSGLLDYILDDFEDAYQVELKVIVVGTGKALQLGRDGEVDLVLTHAPELEKVFVKEGFADERLEVMYNDFILVGPEEGAFEEDLLSNLDDEEKVQQVFTDIFESKIAFVSRGDESGTHQMEKSLWTMSGIDPMQKEGYLLTGRGMGDVLTMANELQAYTLTDRATFYKYKGQISLKLLLQAPSLMKNQYAVMIVNKGDQAHKEAAKQFVDWLISDATQQLIGTYGHEEFGQTLFTPNARK